ncbi:hypothetical protein LTR03_008703 [Friedmanniomyces endolithicus]|nr:hypothetical protein LTR03_008703 [Friedmanniomyces endolithicus]
MTDTTPDGTSSEPARPLRILIIGAGIGGFTTALALRQQGHDVQIFESSKLAQDTGAAIHLASNANGLLRRMGLDAGKIGGVECVGVTEYIPQTGAVKYQIDTSQMSKMWQHPWHLVHRAHLHTALKDMATGPEGKGQAAKLHVGSRVQGVDAEGAILTFEDGTSVSGDLLVGADGVHSLARSSIPGGDKKPFDSGKSAFRFLLPTEVLSSDSQTAELVSKIGALVMWIAEDRRLVMYPCVNKTMMNFVAIHPSKESEADITGAGWQETGSKARMLHIYKDFAPSVLAILEKADESKLKVWQLLDMEQMPSFIYEKLAVVGDAAHPFLPHQGQGGGQAIEDGVALAAVLPLGTKPSEVKDRLQIFEECRYERAHRIQGYTRTAGMDTADLAAKGMKLDMMDYMGYNFGHDAWDYTTKALQKHLEAQDKLLQFRNPVEFGASPGPRRPLGMHPTSAKIHTLRKETPEKSRTYSIRFRTSRTYLQNLLPAGFAFTSPATVASASIICTTLDGMAWLGGGGYSMLGLYIHGINYTKRDGSKVFGTYLPVLFENAADPIITGRDELGMPKLFADIDVKENDGDKSSEISLSWRGTTFGTFTVSGLTLEEPVSNGVNGSPPGRRGPSPPPPPPEAGTFYYRYIPSVGEPGKADVEYPVFIPKPEAAEGTEAPKSFASKSATISLQGKDWQSLPTLHHVANWLAAMPMYGVEEAKLVRSTGVSDSSGARRLD